MAWWKGRIIIVIMINKQLLFFPKDWAPRCLIWVLGRSQTAVTWPYRNIHVTATNIKTLYFFLSQTYITIRLQEAIIQALKCSLFIAAWKPEDVQRIQKFSIKKLPFIRGFSFFIVEMLCPLLCVISQP